MEHSVILIGNIFPKHVEQYICSKLLSTGVIWWLCPLPITDARMVCTPQKIAFLSRLAELHNKSLVLLDTKLSGKYLPVLLTNKFFSGRILLYDETSSCPVKI